MRYSPTAPMAERLRALRAAVDAGKHCNFVVVMPPACGKSVALFDWSRADIRIQTRCAHANDSTAQVRP